MSGRGGGARPPLGFVGLGAMGAPMVRRLLAAGHRVLAHDSNPAVLSAAVSGGAEARGSAAAVAEEAEFVLVSLPTPAVVKAVALGPGGLAEGRALRVYVDLSTTGARRGEGGRGRARAARRGRAGRAGERRHGGRRGRHAVHHGVPVTARPSSGCGRCWR